MLHAVTLKETTGVTRSSRLPRSLLRSWVLCYLCTETCALVSVRGIRIMRCLHTAFISVLFQGNFHICFRRRLYTKRIPKLRILRKELLLANQLIGNSPCLFLYQLPRFNGCNINNFSAFIHLNIERTMKMKRCRNYR